LRAVVILAVVVECAGVPFASAQPRPGTVVLEPAPEIAGVISAGTRPEVVVRGLKSADDPIWVPNVGLLFTESQANRVVRLGDDDQVSTFVGDLHGPLGMTVDAQGRLISLQSQAGFAGPRVIWPTGKETVLADAFEGRPFGRPNDIKGRPLPVGCRRRCTTSRRAARRYELPMTSRARTGCN
jgi:gluconolactonase